jgi:pimeloyl-ACP methyl ester carboxylesterase
MNTMNDRREIAVESSALLYEAEGAGEPIVLVPGGLTGWLSWIPFVAPLARDRRVIRVQLRSVELAEAGRGVPADYSTLTEREGLRATLDALGLRSVDLAGWSFGGHVALAFALEYPQRVRTLTVIEPPAEWILRETGGAPEAVARAEALDRSFAGRAITVDDLKLFLVRAGFGGAGDDFASRPQWPSWVSHRQALSANQAVWDYDDSLDRLRRLDVPILAVKSTATTEDLETIVDDIVALAPRARLLVLPGDHACHLENPKEFLAELRTHTAGVPA